MGREESKDEPRRARAATRSWRASSGSLGEPISCQFFEAEEIKDALSRPRPWRSLLASACPARWPSRPYWESATDGQNARSSRPKKFLDNVARHQSVLEEELRDAIERDRDGDPAEVPQG